MEVYNKVMIGIEGMQIEGMEKRILDRITGITVEPFKKIESFSSIEQRLMKHIIDIEERVVKLRQELSPYEVLKSLKGKAEISSVEALASNTNAFQERLEKFQKKVEKDMLKFSDVFKRILPIFHDLKGTIALRQSNCLVCGKRASSPEFERKVNPHSGLVENSSFSLNEGARNNVGLRTAPLVEESIEIRPRTAGRSKHQMSHNIFDLSKDVSTVVKRKGHVYTTTTNVINRRKYKLPVGYQLMNERLKESSGIQSIPAIK